MNTIRVYDKAMCCSTGVCGPQIDPALARFASDLEWIRSQGVPVERFNLAQQPTAFLENASVQSLLTEKGIDCLPLVIVDGKILSQGDYPSRESLARWVGIRIAPNPLFVIAASGDCCQQPGCC